MITFTQVEQAKINNYLNHLLESGKGGWEEFRCATPEETNGRNILHLRDMLAKRGLTTRGNKAELVERLHSTEPNQEKIRKRYHQNLFRDVIRMIERYGDDGMGDKPEGMCRVEYWLAHLNPDQIRR